MKSSLNGTGSIYRTHIEIKQSKVKKLKAKRKLASCKSELRAVMSWLRRRLRAIQMKQWKKPNKLHRRLRQLGYKGEFKRIKMVSWKNTACQQAHMAMPNKWFKELGLYHPPQLEEGQLLLF